MEAQDYKSILLAQHKLIEVKNKLIGTLQDKVALLEQEVKKKKKKGRR